jgi:hypothetical protein
MNKEPLTGEKLAKTAVNQILNHPNTWNQCTWHSGEVKNGCYTKHCVGGWIQVLGGCSENAISVIRDVRELLGISAYEADWLCGGDRSLTEIYSFVARLSDTGFDRAGFDRDGFNRVGFDRAGKKLTPFEI